jgi:hypothetical protein
MEIEMEPYSCKRRHDEMVDVSSTKRTMLSKL